MSSPAKRRKLDAANKNKKSTGQSRGLEYFFSKQKEGPSSAAAQDAPTSPKTEQTDEELARKLQAEYDMEVVRPESSGNGTPHDAEGSPVQELENAPRTLVFPDVERTKPPPKKVDMTLRLQSSGSAEDSISSAVPLDESPLTFEPAKYTPQLQESWESQGGDATYALLARCFTLVNGTQSRIKIVDTLVNCLRLLIESNPSSLLPAVRNSFYLTLRTDYLTRPNRCGWLRTPSLRRTSRSNSASVAQLYQKH